MASSNDSGDIGLARVGLAAILSGSKVKVPPNQRSYMWGAEHVTDLFDDIENAIYTDKDKDYFLGTVVFTSVSDGMLEVSDGQQRIATTAIIIASIRDYLYSKGDRRAQTLHENYLIKPDLLTEEQIPRIRLNVEDDMFFFKNVLLQADHPDRVEAEKTRPKRESNKNIAKAAEISKSRLASIAKNAGSDSINRILQWIVYLEQKAKVIAFTVKDDADAFMIFETLNDRGLELSKVDLLKNYLFGRAGTDKIQEVQQSWAKMTGALETVTEDDVTVNYARHLWISLHGRAREKELYKKIRDRIKSKQSAVDFASALGSNARQYVALLNASHHEVWDKYEPQTRDSVSLVRTFGWKQARPLMLAVLREFAVVEAQKTFRAFVCWTVRYLITGGLGTGAVEDSFSDCAHKVTLKTITTFADVLADLSGALPTDAEFKAAFAVARVSKPYLARYYLRALERQATEEAEPELILNADPASITLEHILPESPEGGWIHVDEDEYSSLVKRIGNLALLKRRPNSESKSAEFGAKKTAYGQSLYVWTKELKADYEDLWGSEQIAERQKRMAELAVETWPLAPVTSRISRAKRPR